MSKQLANWRKRSHSPLLYAAAAAALCSSRLALAQDNWIVGNGNWSNAANWSLATVPILAENVGITETDGVNRAITYDYTGLPVTLGTLTIDLTGGSGGATDTLLIPANNLTTDSQIIGASGSGAISQSGGINTISSGFFLDLGMNSGATGAYTLSSTGTLTADGNENVGFNGLGNFNQSGGTNSVAGSLIVGTHSTGLGTYTLSSGNLNVTTLEMVGDGGKGSFNQSGGTNTISTDESLIIASASTSTGTYLLSGNSTLAAVGSIEYVGYGGTGNFNQSGGTNGASFVYVGDRAGSNGTYTLSGAGSLSTTGEFVGQFGKGTFNQTGGTNMITDGNSLYIAYQPGSTGTYALSGGSATVSSGVNVGGSDTTSGGNGTLTVSGSGQLTVAGLMQVWNSGRVNINGGSTSVGNLSIIAGGIVNINTLLSINFGSASNDPVSTIVSYLQSGYNGGTWTGATGIISTTAAASTSPLLSLGYVDGNTDTGTPAAANQLLIKLTLAGDANLDGNVDFNDLFAVGQHLNTTGNDWSEGNFNYSLSGLVDFNDLFIIGQNLNQTLNATTGVELGDTTVPLGEVAQVQNTVVVPEPSALALAAVGAAGLLARRRRESTLQTGPFLG